MTPIRNHTRTLGLERGTAVLAFVTCSTFAFGIAALTQSVLTGLLAAFGLLAALVLILGALPGEISP
ncbi:hypothetical protein [Nocardia harenae]|uniref:hypothetical protein n=1 Tax=Nocardia harenae TaxID=358707 RepID=UPI000831213A|nr:hypothetical protein [Nocardia harenae]